MDSVYVVWAIPVRSAADGSIGGWVRVDVLSDGGSPDDEIYLRDGSACGQAEAITRISADPGLLYPTKAEAVRDGIARLRAAEKAGLAVPLRRSRGR